MILRNFEIIIKFLMLVAKMLFGVKTSVQALGIPLIKRLFSVVNVLSSNQLQSYLQGKAKLSTSEMAQILFNSQINNESARKLLTKIKEQEKPAIIEEICKLAKNTQTFQKRISHVAGFYQKNINLLLNWKNIENPEVRLLQLRILSFLDSSVYSRTLINYLESINLRNLGHSHALHIFSILTLSNRQNPELQNYIWERSSQLSNAQFNEQNLTSALQFLRISQPLEVLTQNTIKNYVKFLQNHVRTFDTKTINLILSKFSVHRKTLMKSNYFWKLCQSIEERAASFDIDTEISMFVLHDYPGKGEILAKRIYQNPQKYQKALQKINPEHYYAIISQRPRNISSSSELNRIIVKNVLQNHLSKQVKNENELSYCLTILWELSSELTKDDRQRLKELPLTKMVETYSQSRWYKFLLTLLIKLNSQIQNTHQIKLLSQMLAKVATEDDIFQLSAVFEILFMLNLLVPFKFSIYDLKFSSVKDITENTTFLNGIHKRLCSYKWIYLFNCLSQLNSTQNPQKESFLRDIEYELERHIEQQKNCKVVFLRNILSVYSSANIPMNKYLFLHIQMKLMENLREKFDSSFIKSKNFVVVYDSAKKLKQGSRKFHTFMENCRRNPAEAKKHLSQYFEREAKFKQLREKQRKDKIMTKRLSQMQRKSKGYDDNQKSE